MVATSLLLSLALLSHQSPAPGAGLSGHYNKPLLTRIFPKPAGKNGFEDFLRAIDGLKSRPGVGSLTRKLGDKSVTDPSKAELSDLASTLAQLQSGLRKGVNSSAIVQNLPSSDMQVIEMADRTMPIGAGIKSIAKATIYASDWRVARSDTGGATRDLLLVLQSAHALQPSVLIMTLVGVAINTMTYACIERNMNKLSEQDLIALLKVTGPMLLANPYKSSLALENSQSLEANRRLMKDFKKGMSQFKLVDEDIKPALEQYKKLSPSQRASVLKRTEKELGAKLSRMIAQFDRPEHTWTFKEKPSAFLYPQDPLMELMVGMSTAPLYPQLALNQAKCRTELRLLRLEARISIFKLRHSRYPATLKEAGSGKEEFDPLANKPFEYRGYGTSYTLKSLGATETGVIDLVKWREKR